MSTLRNMNRFLLLGLLAIGTLCLRDRRFCEE